jgi:hypothetical protein
MLDDIRDRKMYAQMKTSTADRIQRSQTTSRELAPDTTLLYFKQPTDY